jgi:hypothetical protein
LDHCNPCSTESRVAEMCSKDGDPMSAHTASASTPLRDPTTYITGHNAEDATAVYHSVNAADWQAVRDTNYFNVSFTTSSMPVSMDNDVDIRQHEQVMASRGRNLGLVRPNGTVCRTVDFAPNGEALMHRTKSLDYGIVIEGQIELHWTRERCAPSRGATLRCRGPRCTLGRMPVPRNGRGWSSSCRTVSR